MHRLVAAFAAFVFLASGSAALAAGPSYVSEGGLGVLAHDGKTRYVAVPIGNRTAIERVSVRGGSVITWADLAGSWGIPAPTYSPTGGEGLSRDGKRLVVGMSFAGSPSRFAILDTRRMRVVDRITLDGDFAYDALSPDASTLYLTEHVDVNYVNRYVVRAYDLRNHVLRPGRIADKTQLDWVMEGSALTRATSGDGRWVYTLYSRPGGYPFVHALDTVNGSAHCIGLPWRGDQTALGTARLRLADDGRSLALRLKSGRTWMAMNTASWRLTRVAHDANFEWRWPLASTAGVLALALAVLSRRRRPKEALPAAL